VIPVRVNGPNCDDDLDALVDTGADDILLPDYLIGVVVVPGDQTVILGIGGSVVVRYGTVDLELPGYGWSARVGFHPGVRAVLGHAGFLEYFTATFNGRRRDLTLTPNGAAPAPAVPAP
jgi:hypothetical protein